MKDLENFLPKKFLTEVKNDKEVIAVLVFGSYARGEQYRDIDVCLVLDKKYSNLSMSKKRLHYLSDLPNKVDLHIFQQLPIYIKTRIMKEGKVFLLKNEDRLYEIAIETMKEFDSFEKLYNMYLDKVENG
ncbi:MAG: nucleotidyltransferase domain-containing protein [Nanoarchaeota archaeon]|nr:nucleotidyltransferase domain-containing protein [Nanoarchaeota archaeon]